MKKNRNFYAAPQAEIWVIRVDKAFCIVSVARATETVDDAEWDF